MANAKKSPYEIYKTHNSVALNNALYSQILEKARKFDISMFQNPDLAKDLCDTTLTPAKLSPKSSQNVIDMVVWLIESRNKAQLSEQ